MLSAKWCPFCLGLNVLMFWVDTLWTHQWLSVDLVDLVMVSAVTIIVSPARVIWLIKWEFERSIICVDDI